MEWDRELKEIGLRRLLAIKQGGEDAVTKQHARGKLTIRERIDALVDAGSFEEIAPLAGTSEREHGQLKSFTPANYVLGTAQIDGRIIAVGGEDFTIRGGSPSVGGLRKSVYAETLALQYRIPLVRLLEGGGGSVAGTNKSSAPPQGPDNLNSSPRFMSIMQTLGCVPVVSAAMGPVAGMPAARLVASHFTLMVKDRSQVMVAGPAIVQRALGVEPSKEELGGYGVHLQSGVVNNLASSEGEALAIIRRFLSYLPSNVWELAPSYECDDPIDRCDERLASVIPNNRRKTYRMRDIIDMIVDRDSFFEISRRYGPSQITGLARIMGHSIGILANDPMYLAGCMTAQAAQKLIRLVDLCDAFHIPIVSLVDQPGFMVGPEAEADATIRYGTAAICAVMQTRVPWVSVMIRKTYGVAGAAHFGPSCTIYGWPSMEAGPLPLEGGVAVAFRREIAAAPDPEAKRRELEESFAAQRSPFPASESCSIHNLIDPRDTRPTLAQWLRLNQPLLKFQLGPKSATMRP